MDVRILDDGRAIELGLDGGRHRFHALWLRDNAWDETTRSPGNGQRLVTILDIPAETRISAASAADGKLSLTFAPEGRTIAYDPVWLARNAYDATPEREPGWTAPQIERWDSRLHNRVPSESWADVTADRKALGRWLAAVRRFGFAVMTETPTEPGTLCKVAELFGYVRETNYGRWFEVRAEVNPTISPTPISGFRRIRTIPIAIRCRHFRSSPVSKIPWTEEIRSSSTASRWWSG